MKAITTFVIKKKKEKKKVIRPFASSFILTPFIRIMLKEILSLEIKKGRHLKKEEPPNSNMLKKEEEESTIATASNQRSSRSKR